jgi:peptide/nickel transport system ATP-binding protein
MVKIMGITEDKLRVDDKKNQQLATENHSSDIILNVENLKTYFYTEEGVVKAVDGVSFKIYKDEVMGLVGETGCGKSVTALSVLRLVREPGKIIDGNIEYKGTSLLDLTEQEMRERRGRDITMIFQDPLNSLNPVFSVGHQVMEVFSLHQMDDVKKDLDDRILRRKNLRNRMKELKISLKENVKLHQLDEIKKELNDRIQKRNNLRNRMKELKINLKENEKELSNEEKEVIEQEISELKEKTNHNPVLKDFLSDLKENGQELTAEEKEKIEQEIIELKEETVHIPVLKDVLSERAEKIINEVGIPDSKGILKRYPHELSGGMRQRVMIAMGLSCNPSLLIADEPTTALDVTIQAQILDLMKDLKNRFQTSILIITHDLGIIAELCDRIAVMYSGNIVEYATAEDLFKQPRHPYTQGLIGAIPSIEKKNQKLQTIRGMVPNLIYPPSGCRFHPRCDSRMEVCHKVKPQLTEIADRYFVACHLFDPKYKDSPKYVRTEREDEASYKV